MKIIKHIIIILLLPILCFSQQLESDSLKELGGKLFPSDNILYPLDTFKTIFKPIPTIKNGGGFIYFDTEPIGGIMNKNGSLMLFGKKSSEYEGITLENIDKRIRIHEKELERLEEEQEILEAELELRQALLWLLAIKVIMYNDQ